MTGHGTTTTRQGNRLQPIGKWTDDGEFIPTTLDHLLDEQLEDQEDQITIAIPAYIHRHQFRHGDGTLCICGKTSGLR